MKNNLSVILSIIHLTSYAQVEDTIYSKVFWSQIKVGKSVPIKKEHSSFLSEDSTVDYASLNKSKNILSYDSNNSETLKSIFFTKNNLTIKSKLIIKIVFKINKGVQDQLNNLLTTVSFGGGNTLVKYFVINDSSSYYSLPNYFESKGNYKQFKIMQKSKFDLMNTSINNWQSVTYEITEDLTRISVNELLVLDIERDPTKENNIVGNYYLEDLTPVEKIIDERISEQKRYSARVKMRNLAVAQFRAMPSNKGKRVPPHISYIGGNEQNEGFKTILIKELKIGSFAGLKIKKLEIADDYNTLFRFEAEVNLGKIE